MTHINEKRVALLIILLHTDTKGSRQAKQPQSCFGRIGIMLHAMNEGQLTKAFKSQKKKEL